MQEHGIITEDVTQKVRAEGSLLMMHGTRIVELHIPASVRVLSCPVKSQTV